MTSRHTKTKTKGLLDWVAKIRSEKDAQRVRRNQPTRDLPPIPQSSNGAVAGGSGSGGAAAAAAAGVGAGGGATEPLGG